MTDRALCSDCARPIESNAWFCPYCAAPQEALSEREAAPADMMSTDDLAFDAGTIVDAADLTEPGAPPEFADLALPVLVEEVVAEGVDPIFDVTSTIKVAAFLERTSTATPVKLSSSESFLLDILDEPRALEDIARQGVFSERELELSVLSLHGKRLIELSDRTGDEKPAVPEASISSSALKIEEEAVDIDVESLFEPEAPPIAAVENKETRPSGNARVARRVVIAKQSEPAREQQFLKSKLNDGILRLSMSAKADEFHKAAKRDRAVGALISARMNLKLAVAFAPDEPKHAQALAELTESGSRLQQQRDEPAWQRYEAACRAEKNGDFDKAVSLLRAAIELNEEPAFYNRLGIILAMRKQEMVLAERMLRRALDLEPDNRNYVQNLARVLGVIALRRRAQSEEGAAPDLAH